MADGAVGQYVKLRKENLANQPSTTEPGELNQPVEVPALAQPLCAECGLPLPHEVVPPQTEPWTSGILACASEQDSCIQGAFCPCVLFGKNVEALKPGTHWTTPCAFHAAFVEGGICLGAALAVFPSLFDPSTLCFLGELLLYAWWICGLYTGLSRQELQMKYHLKNAPCDPCLVHCVLHQCALCQEHREMKMRLPPSDSNAPREPPPEQEMSTGTGSASENTSAMGTREEQAVL